MKIKLNLTKKLDYQISNYKKNIYIGSNGKGVISKVYHTKPFHYEKKQIKKVRTFQNLN